uniref:Uncharacterized protein n=1 Tax=Malurus cyaneus samueli TaxID=2593467 RepID=A0A8C5TXX8_9PASS
MARAPFTRLHGNGHARRTPSLAAIGAHAAPDARAPRGGQNRPVSGGGRRAPASAGAGAEPRLRRLYPAVNQDETPLPRSWSPKDKYNYIGLSQGNLRHGKNHKDAASVRATHPIPAACGIYYFEVKIVSKGRDGSGFLLLVWM